MSDETKVKAPYICGALTELSLDYRDAVKEFYVRLGDVCEEILGVRGFVPHEHYDPIKNADIEDALVYEAERHTVTRQTTLLIVYAIEPSWGAGIEVGWANEHEVPIVVLVPKPKKVSRLLTGGRMVQEVLQVFDEKHAELCLKAFLYEFNELAKNELVRERENKEIDDAGKGLDKAEKPDSTDTPS
jgi:hypothetical protein